MGKSISCLKCGRDSDDQDDLHASSERKGPSDKRRWSFRKRSPKHRVLNNTVITGSPDCASLNFNTTAVTSLREKYALPTPEEKPKLSTSLESNVQETRLANESEDKVDVKVDDSVLPTILANESEDKVDVKVDDSVLITIQTAIRGFLAQKALLKLKNVVRVQAAVRGHLVRRHAVGTLRCVQAIIKMQALVRARHTRLSSERSCTEEKTNGQKEKHNSESMENQVSANKLPVTYTSIEKLLSNRFARQLLISSPKTKPIYINCDPSEPNQSWKWLERWMSMSSPNIEESQRSESNTKDNELDEGEKPLHQMESESSPEVCDSADYKSSKTVIPEDSEETLITYEVNNFHYPSHRPTSTESTAIKNLDENNLIENQTIQLGAESELKLNSVSGEREVDIEQPKYSMKRSGSGKASNPAFIAAQSKFEELSISEKIIGVDPNISKISSKANAITEIEESDLAENSVLHYSSIPIGGSDCGTELSVTSTLDSPDRSDTGAIESVLEAKVSNSPDRTNTGAIESVHEAIFANTETHIPSEAENLSVGTKEMHTFQVSDISNSSSVNQEKIELESETVHQPHRPSLEASPSSNHINLPESQGTPSSTVSSKSKLKYEKTGSNPNHKRKSWSAAAKKSPSSALHDSGARDGVEILSKDQKIGKRRNSFGSVKNDHVDQEQKDGSSSSNSVPSYMQATESARAKANNSPRSSPDVQDKDISVKKRHSLPGTNGRHGSPRIVRSVSQALPAVKGNTQPHERKWLR